MSAPLLQSATYNLATGALTLVFDVATNFVGLTGALSYQRTTTSQLTNTAATPTGQGTTTLVFAVTTGSFTQLSDGTLSFSTVFESAVGATPCTARSGYYVTLVGGPATTSGVPTIGTYDEFVSVYKTNAEPLVGGASQSQIQFFLDCVNHAVVRYCGVQFCNTAGTQQTFTEYLDGNGSHTIRVKNPPIGTVTSVTVYDAAGDADVLDSDTYRYNAQGTIEKTAFGTSLFAYTENGEVLPGVTVGDTSQFPEGFQNVKVIYTGGYTTAPADLRMAVYEIVDECLYRAGVRGTDKAPSIDELVKARAYRLKPFERITI